MQRLWGTRGEAERIGCRNFRCFGKERGEENRRAHGKDKKIK